MHPGQLRRLRSGAVIPLDQLAGEPVDLYAGGRRIARGELLVLDGKIAVRVVELCRKLTDAFTGRSCGLILFWACPLGSSAQVAPAAASCSPPPHRRSEKAPPATLTPPSPRTHADPAKPAARPASRQRPLAGSLALVLGIFFLVVWLFRRALPQGRGVLPPEAFEVLGRAALANRQQAQLLRCGNKLLLVCVGAAGRGNPDRNHRPGGGRAAGGDVPRRPAAGAELACSDRARPRVSVGTGASRPRAGHFSAQWSGQRHAIAAIDSRGKVRSTEYGAEVRSVSRRLILRILAMICLNAGRLGRRRGSPDRPPTGRCRWALPRVWRPGRRRGPVPRGSVPRCK